MIKKKKSFSDLERFEQFGLVCFGVTFILSCSSPLAFVSSLTSSSIELDFFIVKLPVVFTKDGDAFLHTPLEGNPM